MMSGYESVQSDSVVARSILYFTSASVGGFGSAGNLD